MKFSELNESFNKKYGFDNSLEELDTKVLLEDSLEEGLLDNLKGGVNMARSFYNDKRADRLYSTGNFIGGQEARTKAYDFRRKAQDNFADGKYKDISSRAAAKLANAKELDKNNKNLSKEYINNSREFISSANKQFKKYRNKKDLSKAYHLYLDELTKTTKGKMPENDPVYKELKKAYVTQAIKISKAKAEKNRQAQTQGNS